MASKQTKKSAPKKPVEQEQAEKVSSPSVSDPAELDDLLEEMDEAMGNLTDKEAEAFVQGYVQKGGE